ncbi:MAG: acyl-CoA dehydrogenase family protein, partial [Woeseiaceae bacterium]|nr:acyl-CoA dehydrogenase family protein [Woeseiaceae bacterium]
MNLGITERLEPILVAVKTFINDKVEPVDAEFLAEVANGDRWVLSDRQKSILKSLKAEARKQGLWNFWLTDSERGHGLTTVEYAYIAEQTGRSHLAAEAFNCSAPDTGNMEVLERFGTPEQKKQWLEPLLDGEIRSAYAMTEPDVASSDATNVSTSAVLENGDWIINGDKTYISGAGDERCKIMICMVRTDPDGKRHQQHSQILVPMDAPGVEIVRPMNVFANDDAPHGHMHIRFDDVRVPEDNMILGPGRGFEIAQGRLGPGRIHHCMRAIGMAEKALELMCVRSIARTAFGRPLAKLGGNYDRIAEARMNIDMARLLTLQAAH